MTWSELEEKSVQTATEEPPRDFATSLSNCAPLVVVFTGNSDPRDMSRRPSSDSRAGWRSFCLRRNRDRSLLNLMDAPFRDVLSSRPVTRATRAEAGSRPDVRYASEHEVASR